MEMHDPAFPTAGQAKPRAPAPTAAPDLPPALLRQALDDSADGVLIVSCTSPLLPILHANPAFGRLTGLAPEQLTGDSARRLAENDSGWAAALEAGLAGEARPPVLLSGKDQAGLPFWHELRVAPAGACLLCTLRDVSDARVQQSRLAHVLVHDELTGLPNRAAFPAQFRSAISCAAERGQAVAVLSLALDGQALVNETLGQFARDALVHAAAARLKACLPADAALARHAENEFVLILPSASAQEIVTLCERIAQALAAPLELSGQRLFLMASMGIARYPNDGADEVTLLRYADMALAHARGAGGNRHQFFVPDMHQRALERIQMEAALRLALDQGQLQLQYQPVADLQNGAVCALEALLRWNHPVEGLIPARRFIAVAEDAGLTNAIGQWTLERACADIRAWRDAGLAASVRVAVNLSPKQFRDPGLARAVLAALQQSDLSPEVLALEVNEAALMQDAQGGSDAMQRLAMLGVGLTLDDFGTGYTSLHHLKRFPLNQVKIDCALIGNVANGTDEAALVKTIIAMAHHVGLRVAAVGVETELQCDFLRRNMCDQVQGHFFGRPDDFAAISALLQAGSRLPQHLLRIQKQKRTLLLVDDEPNIVSALKRLLRRDNYQILTAHSGEEGMQVLAANDVDVIVSDQRMPGMIGADFLRAAKGLYPDTIRIMLSGYTELQSVTDAVNEGAIYKFLTKPWDDEQLRGHIADAFRLKEIADDNERLNLELRTANQELALANRRMEDLLRQKQQQISNNELSLKLARELLQFVPLPVIGIDDEGMVAFINEAAERACAADGPVLGHAARAVLPGLFADGQAGPGGTLLTLGQARYQAVAHALGGQSPSRGNLITLSLYQEPE